MCIIIDTNTLANVFEDDAQRHHDFLPVREWVLFGRGKVIYGGSKYTRELNKYLGLFNELRKKKRAIYIDDHLIDAEEIVVGHQIQHANFDDQHLVALLRISGCKLICSLDERAYPYFRHEDFFGRAAKRPRIYNQYRNRDLLVQRNIAPICQQ